MKTMSEENNHKLILAITKADEAGVRAAIDAGADVNQEDKYGYTPLIDAARAGFSPEKNKASFEIAKILIAAGADVHVRFAPYSQSLLHYVSRDGMHEFVEMFLEAGIDANVKDELDRTPAHWATGSHGKNKDPAVLKALIKRGADVNAREREGYTPLHEATRKNASADMLKTLIGEGADVHAKEKRYENTPLFFVAGNVARAQVLLDAGADIEARNKSGETPLFRALGCAEATRLFLERGANVNVVDRKGQTPLHHRANPDSMEALIATKGSDVHAKDERGFTPLHSVVNQPLCEVPAHVQVLLEAGADVNARDRGGNTPLMEAVVSDKPITAKVLIEGGASLNEYFGDNFSLVHKAVLDSSIEVLKVLVEGGAEVETKDRFGDTPLHTAAIVARPETLEVVQLLLDRGANPMMKNENGKTAWDYAQKNPSLAVTDVLCRLKGESAASAPGMEI